MDIKLTVNILALLVGIGSLIYACKVFRKVKATDKVVDAAAKLQREHYNLYKYLELERELVVLMQQDPVDTEAEERLRDRMDSVWATLTSEQIAQLDRKE